MTVRLFSVDYKKANEHGAFSPGDTLSGQVTVVTSSKIKAQCLLVKAKGKAQVGWCEQGGKASAVCSDKRKYFSLEHIILQDKNKGDGSEMIHRGRNVYPFTFEIPNTEMPSTYEGKWGRISYTLRAQLTQSIWRVYKAKTEFPFVTNSEFPFASKAEMIIIGLKKEQSTTKTSFFGSAKVTVSVTAEKMGVRQGEALEFSVRVLNDSAQSLVPMSCLWEKQTFAAQSKRMVHTDDILCESADCVPPRSSQTFTKALRIPPELPPTFFNCCMMKLEYRLKVSIDVPLPGSLEVKLPVVILMSTPEPRKVIPKRSAWFGKLRHSS